MKGDSISFSSIKPIPIERNSVLNKQNPIPLSSKNLPRLKIRLVKFKLATNTGNIKMPPTQCLKLYRDGQKKFLP